MTANKPMKKIQKSVIIWDFEGWRATYNDIVCSLNLDRNGVVILLEVAQVRIESENTRRVANKRWVSVHISKSRFQKETLSFFDLDLAVMFRESDPKIETDGNTHYFPLDSGEQFIDGSLRIMHLLIEKFFLRVMQGEGHNWPDTLLLSKFETHQITLVQNNVGAWRLFDDYLRSKYHLHEGGNRFFVSAGVDGVS
jgi:hypothetical protein